MFFRTPFIIFWQRTRYALRLQSYASTIRNENTVQTNKFSNIFPNKFKILSNFQIQTLIKALFFFCKIKLFCMHQNINFEFDFVWKLKTHLNSAKMIPNIRKKEFIFFSGFLENKTALKTTKLKTKLSRIPIHTYKEKDFTKFQYFFWKIIIILLCKSIL